jgi:hypothetical protein
MSSFVKKTDTVKKEASGLSIKPFMLPMYIILSAVFILYIAYSYATGVVYKSGIMAGQQAGQQQAQQAGYEAAIAQLLQQAGSQCEPISISLGEKQVNVINVACLQAAPQENIDTEVSE